MRTVAKIARWYLGLRPALRYLIVFIVFVLPLLLYAYQEATTTISERTAPPPPYRPAGWGQGLEEVPCSSVIRAKYVFVAGPFAFSDCYRINRSVVIYMADRPGVLLLYNISNGDYLYILAMPARMEVGNNTVSYVTLAIRNDANPASIAGPLTEILENLGLKDQFCGYFKPAQYGWNGKLIPSRLYYQVCGGG